MSDRIFLYIVFFSFLVLWPSCGERKERPGSEDSVSQNWNDKEWGIFSNPYPVVEAVKNGDVNEFASLCRYPVLRVYPLKDIKDSADMVRRFPTIFDKYLKEKIADSSPEDWDSFGWRGISLENGEYIWIDEEVYAIPYQSLKEKNMLDSVISMDLATLPSSLSKGWLPEFCFLDTVSSMLYRIDMKPDADENEVERCRVITIPSAQIRNSEKMEILSGIKTIEGSMAVRNYSFTMKDGKELSLSYIWQEDLPALCVENKDSVETYRELKKVYWLDFFSEF